MTRTGRAAALLALVVAASACVGPPPAPDGASAPSAPPFTAAVGDAELSVSTVPATSLGAPVAARYDVDRKPGRVLILVDVREDGVARRATLRGQARDLRGVAQTLRFREVATGDHLEYVAIARATAPDTLRFELDVALDDGTHATLRFSRDLVR